MICVLKRKPSRDTSARTDTEVTGVVCHHALMAARGAAAVAAVELSAQVGEGAETPSMVEQVRATPELSPAPSMAETPEVAATWARPRVAAAAAKTLRALVETRELGSSPSVAGEALDAP